jgi:MinD superfamily P-loop ATPase
VSASTSPTLPLAAAQAHQTLVREIAVISGKGGTGKTSVTASCAVLADNAVVADCDVDAADLHLVLGPQIEAQHEFSSGFQASVRPDACDGCGLCVEHCRFEALRIDDHAIPKVDPVACEGCGVCARICPQQAIELERRYCGQWFVSNSRCGPMVHARLGIAAENSGKLVSLVRAEARRKAAHGGHRLILIDGPPGVGCPVIASVTGATAVLLVTEPSVSGEHDVRRALELTRHFEIPAAVAVNRWDLCPEGTERIEVAALKLGARLAGRIRYDTTVTRAQLQSRSVIELGGPAADDIRRLWQRISGWWLGRTAGEGAV